MAPLGAISLTACHNRRAIPVCSSFFLCAVCSAYRLQYFEKLEKKKSKKIKWASCMKLFLTIIQSSQLECVFVSIFFLNAGDVQIGLMDKKGQLEVEVIRARGLTPKPGSKSLPGTACTLNWIKHLCLMAECETEKQLLYSCTIK